MKHPAVSGSTAGIPQGCASREPRSMDTGLDGQRPRTFWTHRVQLRPQQSRGDVPACPGSCSSPGNPHPRGAVLEAFRDPLPKGPTWRSLQPMGFPKAISEAAPHLSPRPVVQGGHLATLEWTPAWSAATRCSLVAVAWPALATGSGTRHRPDGASVPTADSQRSWGSARYLPWGLKEERQGGTLSVAPSREGWP